MAKHIGHLELFALPIANFGRKRSVSLATQSSKLGSKLYQFIAGID